MFNIAFLCVFAVLALCMLAWTLTPGWSAARAARQAYRAGLPLGSAEPGVRRRITLTTRVNVLTLIALAVAFVPITLALPAGSSPFYLWIVTIAIMGAGAVTSVATQLHERLFRPAPDAVRVARVRSLQTKDYLGRWARRLPGLLLWCSIAACIVMPVIVISRPGHVGFSVFAVAAAAFAFAGAVVAARWAERAVLDRPQPASNTIELAWDDLFRTDALLELRRLQATAAWIPFGIATSASFTALAPYPTAETAAGMFPWWGIPVVMCVYAFAAGRLRPGIHPAAPEEALA